MKFTDINSKRTEILNCKRVDMKKFGRLPKGYQKWVDETLFDDHFMIYNNKTRSAHCTLCGKSHTIPKGINYKNNYTGKCPMCSHDVVYHRYNMTTGKIQNKWCLIVQAHKDDVLLRYIHNIKIYNDDYTDYEISYEEKIRDVIGEDYDRTWQYFWGSDTWLPWRDEQFDLFHKATEYDVALNGFTVYKPNLIRNTIKDTWAKYSGLEAVVRMNSYTNYPWGINHYLLHYKRNHGIEKLAKVGFEDLMHYANISKNGNSLSEILELSKYQTKLLLHCGNPTLTELNIVKDYPTKPLVYGKH